MLNREQNKKKSIKNLDSFSMLSPLLLYKSFKQYLKTLVLVCTIGYHFLEF